MPRRARVQARQIFVYATAAAHFRGDGRWEAAARRGYSAFVALYRRPDGAFANLVDEEGRVVDPSAKTYEQAFAILAMSALAELGDAPSYEIEALKALDAIGHRQCVNGGFAELGDHRFQANANMHLFEAAMSWERRGLSARWIETSDAMASFAMQRLVDPESGLIREYFDEHWCPLEAESNLVEPGHLFEWSWLLGRWGRSRRDKSSEASAHRLFELGLRGVDRDRGVAINSMWADLSARNPSARLWPQTEYLKAALLLENEAHALAACNVLAGFLDTSVRGAWRDTMKSDGSYVDEPAPASSFYHLLMAMMELLPIERAQ